MATLGRLALSAASLDEVYAEAVSVIAQGLSVEFSNVLVLEGSQKSLVLQAGIGWKPGWMGQPVGDTQQQTHTSSVFESHEPVIIHDFSEEPQFIRSELLASHGIVSSVDVLVGGLEKPVGVLGAYSTTIRHFSADDVSFLQGVANILSAAAERHWTNQRLSHMALHDSLTDLPNRSLLTDRLNVALSFAHRHNQHIALLFLDLDLFKHVNDEPPRLYRRLHILRGWSHELTKTIFPRSPGASCSISP